MGSKTRVSPSPPAQALARTRALNAAVAYGRVARALHASPHTLARLVRAAPAEDEAARRASVWAALSAYFGGVPRAERTPPAAAPLQAKRVASTAAPGQLSDACPIAGTRGARSTPGAFWHAGEPASPASLTARLSHTKSASTRASSACVRLSARAPSDQPATPPRPSRRVSTSSAWAGC